MATVATVPSNNKDLALVLQGMLNNNWSQSQAPLAVCGFPINAKITLTAADLANGNYILISPLLPNGTHIQSFRGTPSDMDNGGSPSLAYEVWAVTVVAGVVTADVLKLVAASANAQAAADSDTLLAACRNRHIGNTYIAIKITAGAATPAAGTYKWGGTFYLGTYKPGVQEQPFIGDAEA